MNPPVDTRGKAYEVGQRVARVKFFNGEWSTALLRVTSVFPLRFGTKNIIARPDKHLILEDLPE